MNGSVDLRERALRALARARQRLARARRGRDQALRVLADYLQSDLRAERAAQPAGAARKPSPAASAEAEAELHRAQDRAHALEKELSSAQEAVANLVQRVGSEHRRWKAALLSDRRRLLSSRRKDLEADLAGERETVANLMDRIVRERRRWSAAVLFVRRSLLKMKRRPSPEAVKRLAAVEAELEASREACANLMVALSTQKRGGQARLLALARGARKDRRGAPSVEKQAPEAPAPAPVRPAAASSDAIRASLRRLAESQEEEFLEPEPAAEASRDEARGIILTALAAAPPRPASGDLRAAVARRLLAWEPTFRAKRFAIVPPDGPNWPKALFEGSVLRPMLDELLCVVLARMPRAGALVVKGGRAGVGGAAVEFLCGGTPPGPRDGGAEAGLTLVRAIAQAWGGDLELSAGPRGRGNRIRLRLASD